MRGGGGNTSEERKRDTREGKVGLSGVRKGTREEDGPRWRKVRIGGTQMGQGLKG